MYAFSRLLALNIQNVNLNCPINHNRNRLIMIKQFTKLIKEVFTRFIFYTRPV